MASTATTRLRLEKQGTGDNNNSWGAKLNTTGLDLIDAAIAGMASYTLSGSKTLTSNNYAADESRMPFQNITGGTGGTVTVPAEEGRWAFRNGATGDVIVTTGSGAIVTLESGDIAMLLCDGTNVYAGITKSYVDGAITDAAFGGISLGSGVSAMLANFTSANIRTACTDETGSGGSLVFSASPAFTGTPTVPTATAGTNTTQAASTAFVTAAVTATGAITASSTTTLTNKNVSLADNTLAGTTAQFNAALSDGDFMTTAGTETGANKTFITPVLSGTASGTVAGRLGYLSGALSFGDGSAQRIVVTTDNTQTLSGKTIALGSNTVSGTKAQFNTACTDGDFVYTDAIGSSVQGYDADLAAIAALSTQTFGRSLLTGSNAAAVFALLGVTVSGSAASGKFSVGDFVITWRDVVMGANTSTAFAYGDAHAYTSWSKAWVNGDDGNNDVSVMVTSTTTTTATVRSAMSSSATIQLFSIGV